MEHFKPINGDHKSGHILPSLDKNLHPFIHSEFSMITTHNSNKPSKNPLKIF